MKISALGTRISVPRRLAKTLVVMKLTTVLLLAFTLQVAAKVHSQGKVTLNVKNAHLVSVLKEIRKQTGYLYTIMDQYDDQSGKVSVSVEGASIEDALNLIFKDLPFTYAIIDNTIIVKPKEKPQVAPQSPNTQAPPRIDIQGHVTDSLGNPLAGASVTVKGMKQVVSTDENGNFRLTGIDNNATLVISYVGYDPQEIRWNGKARYFNIVLKHNASPLDEVQVIAYGTTTRRLNTGDVSSVTADQIQRQPVTNILGALEGVAPGLSVTQSDGLPGGYFNVSIRGKSSMNNSTDPLYIVDGVPFLSAGVGAFPGNEGESSPLNSINPGDIERIDILKDGDATAIYGSRGANGVILITTKKGKPGKGSFSVNAYRGNSQATRLMKWLNTPQYLEMRREAFKNDSIAPDIYSAPDLLVWDTTRYTDWQKLFLGGTAHTEEVQAALTGGTGRTQFRLASTYHHETPLYASSPFVTKDYGYSRGSFAFSLSHASQDNKFSVGVNAQYTTDKSNYSADVISEVPLPPDAPAPFNSEGELNWSEGGASFQNPFGTLLNSFDIKTNTLITSSNFKYTLLPGLSIKANVGYTKMESSNVQSTPLAAQDPATSPYNSSTFNTYQQGTWIIEPQLEYIRKSAVGKFELLAGATWQDQSFQNLQNTAGGYSSDVFLGTLTGAAYYSTNSSTSDYRYNAFYGRFNYDYEDKYLLNITGRRDGSSRFGPGRQFANFGAVGAAWIFTRENWFRDHFRFLSFGKLRGSYGITGSDNIGNYKFADTWLSYAGYAYDGVNGFYPSKLNNPDYAWEINRKLEGGLELGFFKDRLLLTASYYRNRTGNQLINYALPIQTGFSSVLENFPAVVQNSGFEGTVNSTNIRTKHFQWTTTFNVSINRNQLLSFPGLATSSYASRYEIGESITIMKYFQYRGVDPQTGIYTFNGTDYNKDRTVSKDPNGPPRFYGGMENRLAWKNWDLTFLFQFSKAYGSGYASRMADYGPPGTMNNQPAFVLSRWRKPGDKTSIQRFTTSGDAYDAYNTYSTESEASVVSTSFIRFKNVSLAYNFSSKMLHPLKFQNVRVYVQGQNLGIITAYQGGDPESGGVGNPLLRVLTGGIQFDF